jgi:solute carrier family 6 amino acid transporter-like protein 5/7/9/14
VRGGPGLAFVSYPDAITKFDAVPQLFSVLFFIMLYVLGIGTAVALLGSLITVIRDSFPNIKYLVVAVVVSVLGFVGGLIYVTPGGLFLLALVDYYGANFSVFILGTVEIVGLAWIYGVNNLCDDVEFMLERKTGIYWRICWGFVTPVLMIAILLYSLITMQPETYNNELFPTGAYVAGWFLFAFGVGQLPLWIFIVMYKTRSGSFLETMKSSFGCSELWRPQSKALYMEWKDFKERKRMERELLYCDESLWQKIVRTLTGYSPLGSKIVDSNNTPEK